MNADVDPEFSVDGDNVIISMNGVSQSAVNTADPTQLEFVYMCRMADYLDLIAPEGQRYRVVHVGGAGMALPRYVAATRPTSPQIVLEPNERLTDLVRVHIPLPTRSGIKIRPVDGRAGLEAMRDDFARVIIVDAFAGASVPKDLVSLEYFREIKRVLTADGLLLMNVIDQRPFVWARRVVAGLEALFSEVNVGGAPQIFNQPRFGNLVLAATDAALPLQQLRRRSAGAMWPNRILAEDEVTRLISGAEPFTDVDSEPSPVGGPEGGLRFV